MRSLEATHNIQSEGMDSKSEVNQVCKPVGNYSLVYSVHEHACIALIKKGLQSQLTP